MADDARVRGLADAAGAAMRAGRAGNKRQAARIFRDVLAIAPPADQVPPELRDKLDHARTAVEVNAAALAAELKKRTAALRARHAGESLERYEECEAVQLGG